MGLTLRPFSPSLLPPVEVGLSERNTVMLVFPPEHLWVGKLEGSHIMDLLCFFGFFFFFCYFGLDYDDCSSSVPPFGIFHTFIAVPTSFSNSLRWE